MRKRSGSSAPGGRAAASVQRTRRKIEFADIPDPSAAQLKAMRAWAALHLTTNLCQFIAIPVDARVLDQFRKEARQRRVGLPDPHQRRYGSACSQGRCVGLKVHLHQHEDDIIFIRMGTGVATLGDREVPVAAGATIYVPQGQWHGLRNNSQEVLGMTAIYSPAGFEQIFQDRLLHPNRTPADAEAVRKKHGIVYRDRP